MTFWRTKSIEALKAEAEGGGGDKLVRALGSWNLIALGIGCIIGAGLFSITGIAAADNAGPAIVISFILAAISCTFAGLCFSEFASMIPVSGSVYTYAYATMGEFVAWLIGWLLVLEYAIGAVAVSISWSSYVVSLLHSWGIHLPAAITASPWQPVTLPDGTHQFGIINLPALIIVVLLSLLLIFAGIKKSATANSVFVIIKVAVVLIFIGLGVFYVKPENYIPFIPENTGVFGEYGWSGILRAAGIVFFAYIGFDSVATAAQETKNPQKNLPIGIIGSLIICTILYIAFSLVLVGLVPFKELDDPAPIALAFNQTPFTWINWLVKVAIIAGLTSVILVLLLGQSRVFYAMSKDGLLPKAFSTVGHKHHTPWVSNIIIMIFVGLCASFAPLTLVGHMTSLGTLAAFAIVCGGILILRKLRPELPRPFRTPWVPFIPIMGILCSLALMVFLGIENWVRLLIWLGIGVIIYLMYSRHNSHMENIHITTK